jgi:hypothetical protein
LGRTFAEYIYLDQSASTLAHEIGHMIGHGAELYGNAPGDRCAAADGAGYLGPYALMGGPYGKTPAMDAVNRWRFGFARARYLVPGDGAVTVTLPRVLATSDARSLVVIHPDPSGHPDELFVVENRGKVTAGGFVYDELPREGMFLYHVKMRARSAATPLVDLVNDPAACPGRLVPHQGELTPTTLPAAKLHDGTSARFSIRNVRTDASGALTFTVTL